MLAWWQVKQAALVVGQNLLAGNGAADQILELPLFSMIHITSQKSYRPWSIVSFFQQLFLHDVARDTCLLCELALVGFIQFL